MSPDQAAFPGFQFTTSNETYFIGLFPIANSEFPDVTYPALLKQSGSSWSKIDERGPMWNDQQEDFDPERMASLIIDDFNKAIAADAGGGMSWNQRLAAIFQLRLSVAGNQLVINPL